MLCIINDTPAVKKNINMMITPVTPYLSLSNPINKLPTPIKITDIIRNIKYIGISILFYLYYICIIFYLRYLKNFKNSPKCELIKLLAGNL